MTRASPRAGMRTGASQAFGETLDLHDIAWDVYLIYKPGIKWEAQQPPRPTFWMHQLQGVDPKLLCAKTQLALVGKLLEQAIDTAASLRSLWPRKWET